MNYKKILNYLIFLLPWFISVILFKIDTNYYQTLDLPFFAPPPILFAIIWPILYILIALTLYIIWDKTDKKYRKLLIINYIANELYTFFFFKIKNNFLALTDTIVVLITSILLYKETKKIDKKAATYLIPYVIWNIFATLLSISIYFMN